MYGEGHHHDVDLRRRISASDVRAEIGRALQFEPLAPFERLVLLAFEALLHRQDQLAERMHTLEAKASQALRVIADEHDDNRSF